MQEELNNQAVLTKRAAAFKEIRWSFGRTQREMASALGISTKAVQSYEQGWRPVPVRVMIQLLTLLSLYKNQNKDSMPCWEIRNCRTSMRKDCPSFTVGRGQFCWFIGTRECKPPGGVSDEDAMPCMSCPVVQRLLKGDVAIVDGRVGTEGSTACDAVNPR